MLRSARRISRFAPSTSSVSSCFSCVTWNDSASKSASSETFRSTARAKPSKESSFDRMGSSSFCERDVTRGSRSKSRRASEPSSGVYIFSSSGSLGGSVEPVRATFRQSRYVWK